MSYRVFKGIDKIDIETRLLISQRYHTITRTVNKAFWKIDNKFLHSLYVGSYGRGTSISTSDIDILLELPKDEYYHYDNLKGNGQSRLIQAVKENIIIRYPKTSVHGDGQVVVVQFSNGMKFELLPAFKQNFGNIMYTYPDTHLGGTWKSTNPRKEQDAMKNKNGYYESNGLLFDTCKHIRFIRDNYFASYHLSGIVIDAFVYANIGDWHWLRDDEERRYNIVTFEEVLLRKFNNITLNGFIAPILQAPGSNMNVDTHNSIECLGKILRKMTEG